ncbi:phage tail tape measure protein [Roseicitreum antarcticum]|uniref:Phage tail tape measure protein, lambda family n=1 Tax=Roseicitreum antarcticum TaxID=564137 RepID=A0A1H3FE26_9RHOB|nr:phage tail tape measure protein [Roseicitreum antarcticum]SDX89241.1 phage tail tape measure protein, lambda family [Roseicitreum antarcticum]
MAEKRVSVRLSATGGRQVKAELEGVGEAGSRGFGRLSREMEGANARLAAFARRARLAMAAAAGAIAAAATAMIRSGLQTVDAQAKLAASLDTTVASMQVLERAGELAGVSMSGIEQATKDLTRRLSQAAAGSGPAADALERLGLSVTGLMALPLDQRIGVINAAIAAFVPVAERAAVAGQFFGEEGSIAMSRIDTATLRQATQDVRDFGVVVAASGLEAEAGLVGARAAAAELEDTLDATGDAAGRAGGAGRGAGQALREAADTARGAWEATADAVRAAQERSREIAQGLAEDIAGPIKEALKSGEFSWETFASAISRIAQNLANRLIELAFKPIENAIMRAFSGGGGGGGIGGFLGSLFGFARGGAFAGGQELTAFARGGVVKRPAVFPFSRGIGLMGEAGPEAILPLRRGRDGRLGVEMNGAAKPASGPDMSTRIINVLDPSVVGDYLATPSGERAILNVIRRNRSALNA